MGPMLCKWVRGLDASGAQGKAHVKHGNFFPSYNFLANRDKGPGTACGCASQGGVVGCGSSNLTRIMLLEMLIKGI